MSESNICPDCGDHKVYDDGRAHSCFLRCPRCLFAYEKESYSKGICSTCNSGERRAWVAFAAAALPAYITAAYQGDKNTLDDEYTVGPACLEADALLTEYRKRFGKGAA